MADGVVRVAPDSTGKNVDTSEITSVAGVLVERQRVVLGDPVGAGNLGVVTPDGKLLVKDGDLLELLGQILVELKVHTTILAQGFSVEGDDIRDALTESGQL